MLIIVGLGNPGPKYLFTRHNAGFMVVDMFCFDLKIVKEETKSMAICKKGLYKNHEVCIVKPLTYMNRSGMDVLKALEATCEQPENMVVVHDDLDLPVGRLKIVRRGGSGGHKGVQSIVDALGTNAFPRLKIGIGRPMMGESIYEYVLSAPYEEEMERFHKTLQKGVEALKVIIENGLDEAMNCFNGLVL